MCRYRPRLEPGARKQRLHTLRRPDDVRRRRELRDGPLVASAGLHTGQPRHLDHGSDLLGSAPLLRLHRGRRARDRNRVGSHARARQGAQSFATLRRRGRRRRRARLSRGRVRSLRAPRVGPRGLRPRRPAS
ncbi:unnamed protein product [Pelagomonas calceolata]|uniref:Uncharacterized protein n=1 Tax=Pelagomonas calceolata TaxID=35677 RepID=A0A8J2SLS9_9STRA|nr:unnamed protein product [Pelagomonas calceolata]